MGVTNLENLKDMGVHTMNVEEVLDYILKLNEFDEYGRHEFRHTIFSSMFTEWVREELELGMLEDDDAQQMWDSGHVPRVIVEWECEAYEIDFRKLSAEVVTHIW